MRLDRGLAEAAIAPLAETLGLGLRETALGIVRIVNANMMRAIRVVSIERGHDPRAFTLMPFGGAGALHAVEIARELGIRSILVPPAPGILCAEGVAASELEESFVASCRVPLDGDLGPVAAGARAVAGSGPAVAGERQREGDRGHAGSRHRHALCRAELRAGDSPAAGRRRTRGALARPRIPRSPPAQVRPPRSDSRHRDHQRAADGAEGTSPLRRRDARPRERGAGMPKPNRRTGLVRRRRPDRDPVHRRARGWHRGRCWTGPLVVTQFDATTLVPPGSRLPWSRAAAC